jgi:hypothetical protein
VNEFKPQYDVPSSIIYRPPQMGPSKILSWLSGNSTNAVVRFPPFNLVFLEVSLRHHNRVTVVETSFQPGAFLTGQAGFCVCVVEMNVPPRIYKFLALWMSPWEFRSVTAVFARHIKSDTVRFSVAEPVPPGLWPEDDNLWND